MPRKKRQIPVFHLEYVDRILEEYKAHFPITKRQLTSRKRIRPEVENRYAVAYLLRNVFCLTTTDIGALLDRDHSTIIHGLNEVEDWPYNNAARWQVLLTVEKTLTAKYLREGRSLSDGHSIKSLAEEVIYLKDRHKELGRLIQSLEAKVTGVSVQQEETREPAQA